MKSLFVLSILLSVVSIASSAVTLTFVDTKTATVDIDALEMNFFSAWITIPIDVDRIISPTDSLVRPYVIDPPAPSDGLDWIYLSIAPTTDIFTPGPQFVIELTGPETFGLDSLAGDLTLWDDSGTTPLSVIPIVPEPATIILLGLSGLMLPKRKGH